nr:hypothetical protein [Gammaproteobacteria bacterium]
MALAERSHGLRRMPALAVLPLLLAVPGDLDPAPLSHPREITHATLTADSGSRPPQGLPVADTAREWAALRRQVRATAARGGLPPVAEVRVAPAQPLHAGVPVAWLTAGVFGGRAGYSAYGLDAEERLRPNPGDGFIRSVLLTDYFGRWTACTTGADGRCAVVARLQESFTWPRGTGYAHVYLHVPTQTGALLRVGGALRRIAAWLDGKAVEFGRHAAHRGKLAELELTPGWHRLLLKLITDRDRGEPFAFSAHFLDAAGKPLTGVRTQLYDPDADVALASQAKRLTALLFVEAQANLPQPGDALRVRAEIRWRPKRAQDMPAWELPVIPFQAELRVRLRDYRGTALAEQKITATFPASVTLDFGIAPEMGYYALEPTLYTLDGRLIAHYPADGFTVVRGTADQRQRRHRKKVWISYYDLFTGRRFGGAVRAYQHVFPWMERMGVLHNLGSHAGFRAPLWQAASDHGIVLTGDFRDPHNQTGPIQRLHLAERIAPATRYFKAFNEIDIDRRARPSPQRWVEITRWDHEAAKRARADAVYGGSSLARPGAREVLDWFVEALRLGLDRHQDRWDVHVYPQQPPVLEGVIGNSEAEGERGVRRAYRQLQRDNPLDFWLGETGALPWHGFDGLRWQADTTAKLVAWVNSRSDFELIAFCAAFAYARELPLRWDYAMGHLPGEAALYAASALIDGMPYRRVSKQGAKVQAAFFGDTFVIWTTGDAAAWALQRDPKKRWLVVDVVGRTRPLQLDQGGHATLAIDTSPRYVLSEEHYQQLTRTAP